MPTCAGLHSPAGLCCHVHRCTVGVKYGQSATMPAFSTHSPPGLRRSPRAVPSFLWIRVPGAHRAGRLLGARAGAQASTEIALVSGGSRRICPHSLFNRKRCKRLSLLPRQNDIGGGGGRDLVNIPSLSFGFLCGRG